MAPYIINLSDLLLLMASPGTRCRRVQKTHGWGKHTCRIKARLWLVWAQFGSTPWNEQVPFLPYMLGLQRDGDATENVWMLKGCSLCPLPEQRSTGLTVGTEQRGGVDDFLTNSLKLLQSEQSTQGWTRISSMLTLPGLQHLQPPASLLSQCIPAFLNPLH